jgi:23S rRNA (uracil1939-C5)-methyltransferase
MYDSNIILEKVEITDAGSNGKAIGKYNNVIVFVPFAAPGDVVDIKIVLRQKNYLEGRIVGVHRFSENRVTPFCEHFGTCGGCHWQHLMYNDQLKYKRKQVIDNFMRIGKFPFPEVNPIIPSKEAIFYRNKLEYTFNNKRWLEKDEINNRNEIFNMNALGYYIPQRFDRVLDIKQCYLQKAPSNSIRLAMKKFAVDNEYEFYDIKKHKGLLRNIIIRNSSTTGEFMLIVIFSKNEEDKINKILEHISALFPDMASLLYVINDRMNEVITTLDVNLFKGRPYIIEKMENLIFRVGPVSFFQTNSQQAYEMYKIAREYANLNKNQIVYDLYTGTGTIAQFVAAKAKRVIGIEYNEHSVADAKINASVNNIENAEFFAGDMVKVLNEDFIAAHGKPDVIITDPPRIGMHKNVTEQILKTDAQKIVYISCNPATQARDLAAMTEKYKIIEVQPVDMFPQTHHVENIVLLEKNN